MKKILLFTVCALLCTVSVQARKKKSASKPITSAKSSATTTMKGLFTVTKAGDKYYFEIPDSILGRQILATVRFTQTPSNVGKFSGEQINEQTLYFEERPDKKLLLRSSILVNTADSIDAINKAVSISNVSPIIGAFKIESHANKMYKIDVTSFFSDDNMALGIPNRLRKSMGLIAQLSPLSYIESIKSYPMNTEVGLVKTYATQSNGTIAGAVTGKSTLGINISFILLPKKPMQRRLFDPRVGYFSDEFTYFSDHQQRVQEKRFITRWRLEPKDSADMEKMKRGELVEPKKPIVYYIDPATPKQWRPYLIAGVEDWQKAFEAAGFKNAIIAKEWPDSDSTMSMNDARYSVIRYLASPIANAYGPNVHDPRSGEILESHICWYHNVMKLVHDWYMVQASSIDEAARSMRFTPELMGELIRFVSSHEVGHTLGLRHNFGSSSTVPVDSLRNKAWVETHGHTPSIMDYARFNYVAQPEDNISTAGIFPRIGDYDIWAIKWGYTPMWNAYDDNSDHFELEKLIKEEYAKAHKSKTLGGQSRLWFGDGETNTTKDSRCQTEDLGDDAVKASYYGILNLKREIKQLPEWTYQSNDIYSENIKEMYQQVLTQFYRYMGHVMGNIGGVYKNYGTVDEGGDQYINVTKARQQQCLDFVAKNVFTQPSWMLPSYTKSLGSDPKDMMTKIGKLIVYRLSNIYMLSELNPEYKAMDYLTDLTKLIFAKNEPNDYETALREQYVNTLITDFTSSANLKNSDTYRPAVLYTLKQLRKRLMVPTANKDLQIIHQNWVDKIDRALVIK